MSLSGPGGPDFGEYENPCARVLASHHDGQGAVLQQPDYFSKPVQNVRIQALQGRQLGVVLLQLPPKLGHFVHGLQHLQ